MCSKCSSDCYECSTSATNCIICTDPNMNISYSKSCISCNFGYFYDKYTKLCTQCNLLCKECIGNASSQCISCDNSSIIPQKPYGPCYCNENECVTNSDPLQCSVCNESSNDLFISLLTKIIQILTIIITIYAFISILGTNSAILI